MTEGGGCVHLSDAKAADVARMPVDPIRYPSFGAPTARPSLEPTADGAGGLSSERASAGGSAALERPDPSQRPGSAASSIAWLSGAGARPDSRQSSLHSRPSPTSTGPALRSLETPPSAPGAFEAGEQLRLCLAPKATRLRAAASGVRGRGRRLWVIESSKREDEASALSHRTDDGEPDSAVPLDSTDSFRPIGQEEDASSCSPHC